MKIDYLCINNTRHASVSSALWWVSFLYSLPMKYTDPALTIEEQLELLKSYKLAITDEDQVKHFLKVIGYFRLNNYMKYFKDGKQFIANTSIEDIAYLYEFDKFFAHQFI